MKTPIYLHADYVAAPMANDNGPAAAPTDGRLYGSEDSNTLDNLLSGGNGYTPETPQPPVTGSTTGETGGTGLKAWDPGIPVDPNSFIKPMEIVEAAPWPIDDTTLLHKAIPTELFELLNSSSMSDESRNWFTNALRELQKIETAATPAAIVTGEENASSPPAAGDSSYESANDPVYDYEDVQADNPVDNPVDNTTDNSPATQVWELYAAKEDIHFPDQALDPNRPANRPQIPLEVVQAVDGKSGVFKDWFKRVESKLGYKTDNFGSQPQPSGDAA